MRLLHTADWHLGRSIGDRRLLDDQADFCDWLVEIVQRERIDLVLIAGDIYDRPVPPVDAVALLGSTLRRLVACGAKVVAIAGNHDGPDRLSAFDGLTDAAGVVIRGGSAIADPIVLDGRAGPLAVVPIPYLDPLLVCRRTADESARPTHDHLVRRAALHARGLVARGAATIAVAHGFVRGGEPSESERGLAVGSAGRIGTDCFDGYDYVALGHLHKPQTVGDSAIVRYSGSPMAYSFSETTPKQVVVAEVSGPGRVSVNPVEIPVGRRVATLRGTLDELLTTEAYDTAVDCWVRAELTDTAFEARRRLLNRFPHLVEVARVAAPRALDRPTRDPERRSAFEPAVVAVDFWADVTGTTLSKAAGDVLAAAVHAAIRQATAEPGRDGPRPGEVAA